MPQLSEIARFHFTTETGSHDISGQWVFRKSPKGIRASDISGLQELILASVGVSVAKTATVNIASNVINFTPALPSGMNYQIQLISCGKILNGQYVSYAPTFSNITSSSFSAQTEVDGCTLVYIPIAY